MLQMMRLNRCISREARMRNRWTALIFVVFLAYSALQTQFLQGFADLVDCAWSQATIEEEEGKELPREEQPVSMADLSADLLEKLPYKYDMIELSGTVLKTTNTRSYYNNTYGLNISKEGYNIGRYDAASSDYETEQMIGFQEYLDSKGIDLLYVNEPTKYIDDSFYQEQFGGESFTNRNMDTFLSRIRKEGISCLDLRDNIREENIDPLSLFYRTDHHWTVPASKWAATLIAERLNEEFQYGIDLSLYDGEQFKEVFFQDSWLGEQGRKVAKSYIGLDDYTMIEPSYPTDYTIKNKKGKVIKRGDFGCFIDKKMYDRKVDVYDAPYWHYSYNDYVNGNIINNRVKSGKKVLLLGDSYEYSMAPFLSLGLKELQVVIPRELPPKVSVRDFVEKGDFDMVIIAYAQFMLGSHDDETDSNYRMYTLD